MKTKLTQAIITAILTVKHRHIKTDCSGKEHVVDQHDDGVLDPTVREPVSSSARGGRRRRSSRYRVMSSEPAG